MPSQTEIQVRPRGPRDDDFIFNSWLKQYRQNSTFAKFIKHNIFFSRHHKIVERILAFPDTKTLVCCLAGESNTILGYLVCQPAEPTPIIHFIYVKFSFRREGVATALFKEAGIDPAKSAYTHRTDRRYRNAEGLHASDFDWISEKFPTMLYDPYLI